MGKTTTAVNLAAALGDRGKKVLLADMDPQGNSTSGVGIDRRQTKATVYDIVINGVKAQEAVVETAFQNLSLLPSHINLAAAEIELAGLDNREARIKDSLGAIRAEYDFVIVDCPPSLGLITTNALTAGDTILTPIQCDYSALYVHTPLINTVIRITRQYNDRLELEGVLLTMYDGRLNLTQQVVEEVKKYFPQKVFKTVIPRTVRLSEAPGFGQPVLYYDRASRGAEAYGQLAKEIIKHNR